MTSKLSEYYDATAAGYDDLHSRQTNPEHTRAMELGWPFFDTASSVLDVGSGTGRSLIWLRNQSKSLRLLGIEPSQGMIDIAKRNLPDAEFRQGNGEAMPYESGSIDVVIATGIMHHADHPDRVISEMFRVARKGILISDHNNYAFGRPLARRFRMGLKVSGLLNAATFVRQGFKRQGYSKEDGWWYPYSLFDNYADIARHSSRLYIFPTRPPAGSMGNLLFSQGHFCIVAMKS
jgi:SAM-dependent methyltransferase